MEKSLFSLNGYNPIIPNELKKYFKDKIIDNSYLKKLSVLLYSNDKNYESKRLIINKLSFGVDENNREYLTKSKFNHYFDNNNSIISDKTTEIQNVNQSKKINYNLLYYREPKVIINNEKIMMDLFKKKSKLTDKLPYLSRSTNDLINYNYKKDKDKSNIMKNWMNSDNNYLNIIPKIKKLRLKRINLSSQRNYLSGIKDLKTSLSVKDLGNKIDKNNNLILNKESKILEEKEETEKNNHNSVIYVNDKTISDKLKDEKEKDNIFIGKYNRIQKLSNEEVFDKIGNSIEIPSLDLQKGMFPRIIQRKNKNKIDFLFGKHLSGMY